MYNTYSSLAVENNDADVDDQDQIPQNEEIENPIPRNEKIEIPIPQTEKKLKRQHILRATNKKQHVDDT